MGHGAQGTPPHFDGVRVNLAQEFVRGRGERLHPGEVAGGGGGPTDELLVELGHPIGVFAAGGGLPAEGGAELLNGVRGLAQAGHEFVAAGAVAKQTPQGAHGLAERGVAPAQFGQHGEGVGQAPQAGCPGHWRIGKVQQAPFQHPESRQQIPAIDGGNVAGRQRLQGLGVIPIEPMAFVTFETLHGVEARATAHEEFVGRQVAEIDGGEARRQPKAHIGGRRAVGHFHAQRQLGIIRRQPVGGRVDVIVEIAPNEP